MVVSGIVCEFEYELGVLFVVCSVKGIVLIDYGSVFVICVWLIVEEI